MLNVKSGDSLPEFVSRSYQQEATSSATALQAWSGSVVHVNSASAVTITAPQLEAGSSISFYQSGVGALSFAAGTGVTLRSQPSHTGAAGRYAICGLYWATETEVVLLGNTA